MEQWSLARLLHGMIKHKLGSCTQYMLYRWHDVQLITSPAQLQLTSWDLVQMYSVYCTSPEQCTLNKSQVQYALISQSKNLFFKYLFQGLTLLKTKKYPIVQQETIQHVRNNVFWYFSKVWRDIILVSRLCLECYNASSKKRRRKECRTTWDRSMVSTHKY